MEISKSTCYKIRDWLDAMSRKVAKQSNPKLRQIENSKYIGGIKILTEAGAKVLYKPKHNHSVLWAKSKEKIIIDNFTTYQTIGALQMLSYAGIITTHTNNILSLVRIEMEA